MTSPILKNLWTFYRVKPNSGFCLDFFNILCRPKKLACVDPALDNKMAMLELTTLHIAHNRWTRITDFKYYCFLGELKDEIRQAKHVKYDQGDEFEDSVNTKRQTSANSICKIISWNQAYVSFENACLTPKVLILTTDGDVPLKFKKRNLSDTNFWQYSSPKRRYLAEMWTKRRAKIDKKSTLSDTLFVI